MHLDLNLMAEVARARVRHALRRPRGDYGPSCPIHCGCEADRGVHNGLPVGRLRDARPKHMNAARAALLGVVVTVVTAAGESPAEAGSCASFRPDNRYGDVVESLRTRGVSCATARKVVRRFYDYDRDKGRYGSMRTAGFTCLHVPDYYGPGVSRGRCTRGKDRMTWTFAAYTG